MSGSGKNAEDAKAQRSQSILCAGFILQILCVLCASALSALFPGRRCRVV